MEHHVERLLAPERLNSEPDSPTAALEWKHWYRRFLNFVLDKEDSIKLKFLFNYVSSGVYQYISECSTYNDAISVLKNLYVKPINEVYNRHKLAIRSQRTEETIDQYLQALNMMAKECDFKAVTAEKHRDDFVRDAFIRGISNPLIRQRLLENSTLTLNDAYDKARSLELAQVQAQSFNQDLTINSISSPNQSSSDESVWPATTPTKPPCNRNGEETIASTYGKCIYCGFDPHNRSKCPARNALCNLCGKKGHYAKVCKSKTSRTSPNQSASVLLATNFSVVSNLTKAMCSVRVNDYELIALMDTGSSCSLIDERTAKILRLSIIPSQEKVSMASTSLHSCISGQCVVNLSICNHTYRNVRLNVLKNLCADIIIGHDVMKEHSSVEVTFGGSKSSLNICNLAVANIEPISLFENLTPGYKPLAVKSRKQTESDAKFIETEIERLLCEDIIEPSKSPWRAQVIVTSSENRKRRMVIDYSRTINLFTELDAYPIPHIEEIVNNVAKYEVFSTIDMQSAYHQFLIKESDKPYTAFEACGQLYQFKRIPFGVTNGVAAFQRGLSDIIRLENLSDTYVYLDDITVCGKDQNEHDSNLRRFMDVAKRYNLTLNNEKSSFSLRSIKLLGYSISNKIIRPDQQRLKPLLDLKIPENQSTLKRVVGMFAHFSRFIPQFSKKITVLSRSSFPLEAEAISAFENLKSDIKNAAIAPINNEVPFTVETDASDEAIGATLTQAGRPVAFFSRTLSGSECRHSSVEKEAYAIVEAIRKWRHYLLGRHFRLITDQRSVAFMFDCKTSSKIKNEKILRWRLELSCYSYDIVYRPGVENSAADTFSRICSTIISDDTKLLNIHTSLCHPGITRMYHWIKSKNLPYSVDSVKRTVLSCPICCEIKPRFYKHQGKLIKATFAFERLNVDFKGPLPSTSHNRYLLTIVDEYSRYPFAIPCPDMTAETIIAAFRNVFSLFGYPCYIHNDRGKSFISYELKKFLDSNGIATSKSTPYNPRGNGQVERYNGIIWKTIELALKTKNKNISQWETVLAEALHSIRSLLCTSTNETPHERMFRHARRSGYGQSTPAWLLQPGPVFLRNFVKSSKYNPLLTEVTLLDGNKEYAHIRYPDGRESTVSTRYLAPVGETIVEDTEDQLNESINAPDASIDENHSTPDDDRLEEPLREEPSTTQSITEPNIPTPEETPDLRRSSRQRKLPIRFPN